MDSDVLPPSLQASLEPSAIPTPSAHWKAKQLRSWPVLSCSHSHSLWLNWQSGGPWESPRWFGVCSVSLSSHSFPQGFLGAEVTMALTAKGWLPSQDAGPAAPLSKQLL